MSSAMTTLRRALERKDQLEKKLEEGVETYLDFLDEYVNESAQMSETQAGTLIDDIVQWHEDGTNEGEGGFIKVATYINSCR